MCALEMMLESKLHMKEVSPRCNVASFQEHVSMVVRVPLLVRKQGIDHWLNLDGENLIEKSMGTSRMSQAQIELIVWELIL